MPQNNSPILTALIEKNKSTIHDVVALRTSTFGEANAYKAPAPPLSEVAAKVQLAQYHAKISIQETNLASILLGEDIPSLKFNTPTKNITVGTVIVAVALPDGVEDKRDYIGKPMLATHNSALRNGSWPFRMADGTKVYVPSNGLNKEMVRPATEAEAIATVDGLLAVRGTLTVKLFNDKDTTVENDDLS